LACLKTLRFIAALFSHPSAAELQAILTDDASVERDGLLELLFSPDEALQVEPKTCWPFHSAASLDTEAVAARLHGRRWRDLSGSADGRGELPVALDAAIGPRLTSELRIGRNIPAPAADVIDAYSPVTPASLLMMRNAPL